MQNRFSRPIGGAEVRESRARREFGRLRPTHGALGVVAEDVPPIDMPKAFLGQNGTYYDDCWRWMDWRGRHYSWNWAAATTFGGWLAYRRMYVAAGLWLAWWALLVGLASAGVPLRGILVLLLASAAGLGFYGNTLYMQHFRRVARKVGQRHAGFEARLKGITEAGGVDPRAPWVMAVAGLLVAVVVLQASRSSLGELQFAL